MAERSVTPPALVAMGINSMTKDLLDNNDRPGTKSETGAVNLRSVIHGERQDVHESHLPLYHLAYHTNVVCTKKSQSFSAELTSQKTVSKASSGKMATLFIDRGSTVVVKIQLNNICISLSINLKKMYSRARRITSLTLPRLGIWKGEIVAEIVASLPSWA